MTSAPVPSLTVFHVAGHYSSADQDNDRLLFNGGRYELVLSVVNVTSQTNSAANLIQKAQKSQQA